MSTPRKNMNYTSPYSNPVHQYPSQSEDFISFNVGGQLQADNKAGTSGNLQYINENSRQRCQNSSFSNFSKRYSYSNYNNSAQKHRGTPRKHEGSFRNQPHHKEKQEQSSISSYIHPSMTEDPWKEFMVRIESISNSRISLKSEEEKKSESE